MPRSRRELAITGRGRDHAWLAAIIAQAHKLVRGEFADADINQVSRCWRVTAGPVHVHVTLV